MFKCSLHIPPDPFHKAGASAGLERDFDLTLEEEVGAAKRPVPIDVIEAAIRSAFTSYPKEDDPDWRSPHWITPEECVHLAQNILLELQEKGFEIVRRQT